MRFPQYLVFFLALACSAFGKTVLPPPSDSPLLKEGNARVVLVGDSITGQSRNHPAGYAHQMDWALQQAYPDCHPHIIALGGSGQGVQAWLNTEKRSRTESFPLDVKGIDVKAELDQPADVLIIMLGMNDVLAPYVVDEPAAWDKWTADYRELITSLQSRLKPAVTAVATVTLCTEDIYHSPKNEMINKLNEHLEKLAGQMNLMVLPTNQLMRWNLVRGRMSTPEFHVTHDYVHPNAAGHLSIAWSMLRGLGEEKAATALQDQRLNPILEKGAAPGAQLYHRVDYSKFDKPDRNDFPVYVAVSKYGKWDQANPPRLKLTGEDWRGDEGTSSSPLLLHVAGSPSRRENVLHLTAEVEGQTLTRDVIIPAPWLVAAGVVRKPWNEKQSLDAALFRGPIEEAIVTRSNFTTANNPATNKPLEWKPYYATVDYTGGANPDSVDFAAVTHARNFETGYGARWIHSDRERAVNVELSTQVFAGTMQLGVWLNGASVYSGLITGEPGKKKTVPAQLHTGWNTLVFALNHTTWQMQCTVHLAGINDDSLDDLHYSVTPQTVVP